MGVGRLESEVVDRSLVVVLVVEQVFLVVVHVDIVNQEVVVGAVLLLELVVGQRRLAVRDWPEVVLDDVRRNGLPLQARERLVDEAGLAGGADDAADELLLPLEDVLRVHVLQRLQGPEAAVPA